MNRLYLLLALLICASCTQIDSSHTEEEVMTDQERRAQSSGRLFGDSFLTFGGDGGAEKIKISSYLWQSALDRLSFMGLETADIKSGLLETQWYTPPATPQERFKILLTLFPGRLRSDRIRATVLKEEKKGSRWETIARPQETVAEEIEHQILIHARTLKARTGE